MDTIIAWNGHICSIPESESSDYLWIKTSHPYSNNVVSRHQVAILGVSCYRVGFHPFSSTANRQDKVKAIVIQEDGSSTVIDVFRQNYWASFDAATLGHLVFRFSSNSLGTDWGYEIFISKCSENS